MQKRGNDTAHLLKNERGFIMVLLAAGLMLVICAISALAIDAGHAYVVKGELQNAADAAALAGAATLYPSGSYSTPNWELAYKTATDFISENNADGQTLKTGDVQYGWWNVSSNSWGTGSPVTEGSPSGTIQAYCSTSMTACATNADCSPSQSCLIQDVPAVMTKISKTPGVNGGTVPTFFGGVLGWHESSVVSKPAMAVSGFASSVGVNSVFPWAITKCMADEYADSFPSDDVTIYIYSSPEATACERGQWTSFFHLSSVPPIENLMTMGNNPVPLKIGDTINLAPGEKATLFDDVPKNGIDVLFPVVADSGQILGFMAFHIDEASQDKKYIRGRFIEHSAPSNGSPGGPAYGVYTHATLVQ